MSISNGISSAAFAVVLWSMSLPHNARSAGSCEVQYFLRESNGISSKFHFVWSLYCMRCGRPIIISYAKLGTTCTGNLIISYLLLITFSISTSKILNPLFIVVHVLLKLHTRCLFGVSVTPSVRSRAAICVLIYEPCIAPLSASARALTLKNAFFFRRRCARDRRRVVWCAPFGVRYRVRRPLFLEKTRVRRGRRLLRNNVNVG